MGVLRLQSHSHPWLRAGRWTRHSFAGTHVQGGHVSELCRVGEDLPTPLTPLTPLGVLPNEAELANHPWALGEIW